MSAALALAPIRELRDGLRCPSCAVQLDRLPRTREACPACDEPIWVGTAPDGRINLLRETDLAEHAGRWAAHHRRARWIAAAAPFADEDAFFVLEADLREAGEPHTPRDVYRAATERALPAILASGRWDLVAEAYRSMALTEFEQGDEPDRVARALSLAREAATADLRRYPEGRVATAGCDCPVCVADTASIEVAQELAAQRLPHAECATGWCGCDYRPIRAGLAAAFGRRPR